MRSLKKFTLGPAVTQINDYMLYGCSGLTCIEIPNSVTAIGDNAFDSCQNLKKIVFADGSTIINVSNPLFRNCPLEEIYLGRDLEFGSGVLFNSPFNDLYSLKTLTIGPAVTQISSRTFSSCSNLETIDISNSVTSIGSNAFSNCSSLTSIKIPNSVTTIGLGAFIGCQSLTYVEIPNSVRTIGDGAFKSCGKLKSMVFADGNTTLELNGSYSFSGSPLEEIYLGRNLKFGTSDVNALPFSHMPSLKTFTIGTMVTQINDYMLYGCRNLTSIEIPNSVTSIGKYAFFACNGLTSAEIPNSVTEIGNSAFMGCKNLKEVNYNTTEPITGDKSIFSDEVYKNATLNVAVGGIDNAKSTEPWMYFLNINDLSVSNIESIAAYGLDAPTEIYNLNGVRVNCEPLIPGIYVIRQGVKTRKIVVK